VASIMGVQKLATARNAKVEIFVEFLLEQYLDQLVSLGRIKDAKVESQKRYESPIAVDIWDHYVEFFDKLFNKNVQLWCQTTCYKGNRSGKPEPNKTYEVRETLVEAISIRELIVESEDIIRTAHFTIGSKKYTYDWFSGAKEKTFDLSVYIDSKHNDIFQLIAAAQGDSIIEFQIKNNLLKESQSKTEIADIIHESLHVLNKWHVNRGLKEQKYAVMQGKLVSEEYKSNIEHFEDEIIKSISSGIDIKKTCNDIVHGASCNDIIIQQTVDMLLEKNPFIKVAKDIINKWDSFCVFLGNIYRSSDNNKDFVYNLWQERSSKKMVLRRLLLRLDSEKSINYIQDLDVEGVTEHNLYKGNHSKEQTDRIIEIITERLARSNINSQELLLERLTSSAAKQLLRNSIWFEARNGTSLKPSFDYIVNYLNAEGYKVESAMNLPEKPKGYHADLTEGVGKVNAYTNLKAVFDNSGHPLAILKGKFFRPPEFPRRCKEEAYIALTLKYKLLEDCFNMARDIPIIMFIDMPKNYTPPLRIPTHSGHPFRFISDSDSNPFRTPIPIHFGHPFQSNPDSSFCLFGLSDLEAS